MTHSAIDLNELLQVPLINDIDLVTLSQFYEAYLVSKNYDYICINHETKEEYIIQLQFSKEHFCHLLGIESIVKMNKSLRERYDYKGLTGWNNVINGTITLQKLKNTDGRRFRDNKIKFLYFHFLPRILNSPQTILFDKNKLSTNTTVDCEILFYNKLCSAYIHLGLSKSEEANDIYYPKTFLVEIIKANNDGKKFITYQTAMDTYQIL